MSLTLLFLVAAAAAPDPAAQQRARQVLAQARQALGMKEAAAPRGLSLEADLRRVQPVDGGEARDMSGELTVDAQLPDRYLRIETLTPFPGAPAFSLGTGLDGAQAWRAPVGPAPGPHLVVRVAEGGTGGGGPLLRRTRAEMLRLLLAAFAAEPADAALTFAHAGEAEAPEGRADRIDVADADGPLGTLFVDQATHRPLFVSFTAQAPRMQMLRAASREEAERARAGAEARAAAPGPESEARLYVADWKAVDGILLPHRLSQTIEGGTSEEWTVRKWKLDPAFKSGHFKKP